MTHLRPRAPCRLWKDKGTVRENYANLGLAAAVNADAAVAVDVHTGRGMLKGRKTSKLALGTGQLQVASSGILIEESMDVGITTREANAAQSEMDDIVAHAAEPRRRTALNVARVSGRNGREARDVDAVDGRVRKEKN